MNFDTIFMVACVAIIVVVLVQSAIGRKKAAEARAIKESARSARKAEQKRLKLERMLSRQDNLGERVFWKIWDAWRKAGEPANHQVFRIRRNGGGVSDATYYIQIAGSSDPVTAILEIHIDLRKEGKEFAFQRANGFPGDMLGSGYREMSRNEAILYIHKCLIPRLYPRRVTTTPSTT